MYPQIMLDAQGYAPDELFAEWQRLSLLRTEANRHVNACRQQWETTTDLAEKSRLWDELDRMWPHFEVLSAWVELFYSAWVFATRGAESMFMDGVIDQYTPRR